MRLAFVFALAAAAALLVLACRPHGDGDDALLATPPDIRGTVTFADRLGSTMQLRVEAAPADSSGSPKAVLTVERDATVRRVRLPRGTIGDLRVGQVVSAWFVGPVAESYPVRAHARAVVIEADAP